MAVMYDNHQHAIPHLIIGTAQYNLCGVVVYAVLEAWGCTLISNLYQYLWFGVLRHFSLCEIKCYPSKMVLKKKARRNSAMISPPCILSCLNQKHMQHIHQQDKDVEMKYIIYKKIQQKRNTLYILYNE